MASVTPVARLPATSARQNIGPLTTAFEMPPICSTATLSDSQVVGGSLYVLANYYVEPRCEDASRTAAHKPCFPHITAWSDLNPGYFYSPGTQCPSDWVTATTIRSGDGGGGGGAGSDAFYNGVRMNTFLADETAAICCPSNFTYTYTHGTSDGSTVQTGQCFRTITTNEWYHSCGTSGYAPIIVTDVGSPTIGLVGKSAGSTTTLGSSTVPFGGMIASAPTLQLNFRAQDVGSTAAPSPSQSPSGGGVANGASSSSSSRPASSSSGLGGGAIAGIVVGVVLALLAGLAALFYFFGPRRRRSVKTNDDISRDGRGGGGGSGGSADARAAANAGYEKAELAGSVMQTHSELDAAHQPRQQSQPVELQGDSSQPTQYAELDSSGPPQGAR
ncbi:hypothetical protein IF1G_06976 [Cordyceps javanica]|uniref:Uncharacterized protein n=1 Tax=Cordyceps javanica TaxID=43265 RepID=A0A545UXA5_9HYPO|nr:hypothetical protein IF1G_06976 [Cordyceps javanica]